MIRLPCKKPSAFPRRTVERQMEKQHETTTKKKRTQSRLQLGLGGATHRSTETLLELVDATFGIDELLLASKEWMRV